jgi:tetratricopeptide (TPR) repeat protein
MSEPTGNTQPIKPIEQDSTHAIKSPQKKSGRWVSILVSILGVILLLSLGGIGGYFSGLGDRADAKSQVIDKQLTDQFQFALVDEHYGRYDTAKQRLDFIIQNNSGFPGAQAELAKVLVLMTIPTATTTPTLTPTPDLRGEQALFATAQGLIAKGDWANALTELDQLRKEDPKFNTSQVDGMYYFALRNYGVALIQGGNLEGGIYQLTLAERFAPLDHDASALREGARSYIQAAAFFGTDWKESAALFSTVSSGWPSLWDGTMTASLRYQISLMRYGDLLFANQRDCDAYQQYQLAASLGSLDQIAAKNSNQAHAVCYPPTEVPTETAVAPPPSPTPTP